LLELFLLSTLPGIKSLRQVAAGSNYAISLVYDLMKTVRQGFVYCFRNGHRKTLVGFVPVCKLAADILVNDVIQ
jgi:hypothetical protein